MDVCWFRVTHAGDVILADGGCTLLSLFALNVGQTSCMYKRQEASTQL